MILGMKNRDGVYMSSDRQITSSDDTKEDSQKIFRLGRSGLVGTAGSAGICGEMVDLLRHDFSKDFDDGLSYNKKYKIINRLAETVSHHKKRVKDTDTDDDGSLSEFGALIGFLDRDHKRADIISFNSLGILHSIEGHDVLLQGAAHSMCLGFVNQISRGNKISGMCRDEIAFISYKILREIEEVSTCVGNGVDIWSISNSGKVSNYSESELKKFDDMYNRFKTDETEMYQRLYSMLRDETGYGKNKKRQGTKR